MTFTLSDEQADAVCDLLGKLSVNLLKRVYRIDALEAADGNDPHYVLSIIFDTVAEEIAHYEKIKTTLDKLYSTLNEKYAN